MSVFMSYLLAYLSKSLISSNLMEWFLTMISSTVGLIYLYFYDNFDSSISFLIVSVSSYIYFYKSELLVNGKSCNTLNKSEIVMHPFIDSSIIWNTIKHDYLIEQFATYSIQFEYCLMFAVPGKLKKCRNLYKPFGLTICFCLLYLNSIYRVSFIS